MVNLGTGRSFTLSMRTEAPVQAKRIFFDSSGSVGDLIFRNSLGQQLLRAPVTCLQVINGARPETRRKRANGVHTSSAEHFAFPCVYILCECKTAQKY